MIRKSEISTIFRLAKPQGILIFFLENHGKTVSNVENFSQFSEKKILRFPWGLLAL